jgi:TolB-like protein/Tfp pilus assembly protein PilF
MSAVINQPHAPVTELNQEIPHSLAAIIDRALAKTAAERYQSVEEMSGDLRRATETTLPFSPDCCEGAVLPPVAEQTRARPSPFVSRPIGLLAASAALILLVIAAYALWPKPDTAPPINSIAVLPFKPLATESRDEALELGMAEALITRLTGIKQLTVLPVSAVRKYGALDQDAVAAGRQLKVDAVLDGSIQRVGGRTRVTVQLWRVADGRQLWRDAFDDQRESIFALQDSISARTAAALVSRLTGEERQRLAKHYTENTEAYHLYVKGRYIWSKRRREEYGQAIEYFQQAITKDPTYALAWVGLADCYALGGGGRSSRETYPKAKEAATRALELDATLAEAHAAMGKVQMFYDWSLVAAEAEFKHAIELDPNYATAYQYYADCLAAMGRTDEALAQIKLARALDPLSELLIRDTGRVLYYARRYDEAATQCRTALEMNARFQPAIDSLGDIYLQQRRHGEAIAQYQQALKLAPGMALMKAQLAHAYAAAGRSDEAHQILAELLAQAKERPVPAFDLAIIYLGLGNRDEALRQLEQAYEERFYRLIYLGADPLFDPLRSDARFNDLLRRIGLQP